MQIDSGQLLVYLEVASNRYTKFPIRDYTWIASNKVYIYLNTCTSMSIRTDAALMLHIVAVIEIGFTQKPKTHFNVGRIWSPQVTLLPCQWCTNRVWCAYSKWIEKQMLKWTIQRNKMQINGKNNKNMPICIFDQFFRWNWSFASCLYTS